MSTGDGTLSVGFAYVHGFIAYVRTLPARLLIGVRLALAVARLPLVDIEKAAGPLISSEAAAQRLAVWQREADQRAREASVLAVDIGGTRTKFLLVQGTKIVRLPPAPTAEIWQNQALPGPDKFEPATAPRRVQAYLRANGVDMRQIGRISFSVPGTVDLASAGSRPRDSLGDGASDGWGSDYASEEKGSDGESKMNVVKNAPSMSPKFRGFDFKDAFRDVTPGAKVSAVADNLAAALGVACQQPHLRSALVIVLGTAPAVATLFRDPSGKGKYIETAIWQSWVWFTKMKLHDSHGYVGGLKVSEDGVQVKPSTAAKIPHHQARIRFALDDATWRRLRGCSESLPAALQANLSEEDATEVWCRRLQTAVSALAERFHSVYGPPQQIHVLGGNASRCHGVVHSAEYMTPDSVHDIRLTVPVVVYPDDATQQLVHMSGLVYASCFKLKHVAAPGQDPLARGWTRGGEIYLWVAKGVKSEHEISWPPVRALLLQPGGGSCRDKVEANHLDTCAACMRKARGAKAARARLSVPPLPAHGWNRLYLVRHGQTDWNSQGRIQGWTDQPLNATGYEQAAALAAFLADVPLETIFSSQLQRAKATADAVAALHPKATRGVDPRLVEMCFGSFEGEKQASIRPAYRELLRAWKEGSDQRPSPGEGGESNCAVEKSVGRHVCVVTHSRFNKILIAALRGEVSRAVEVAQSNACVNVIDFPVGGGECVMTRLNVCDHLTM